ncbi:hypothetical protein OC846_005153 [Tilletia horrida]|uniref:Methyltransferase type 12 domain-containing protein n=1 Tax=Tilletia horrida TaxID=155126 RepID=A0AAN6JQI2_9BASI|nr:hypothetical protein OC846_005153 [Tilletia horrida]
MSASRNIAETKQQWDKASARYDDTVGQLSTIFAHQLIEMTEAGPNVPLAKANILELGAGTGNLAHQVLNKYPDVDFLATDVSQGMLDVLVSSTKPGTGSRLRTKVLDLNAVTSAAEFAAESEAESALQPHSFTHVMSTFAFQRMSDPATRFKQYRSLLVHQPDSVFAVAIWDLTFGLPPKDLFDKAAALATEGDTSLYDPAYSVLPPGAEMVNADQLRKHLEESGLWTNVQIRSTQSAASLDHTVMIPFFFEEDGHPVGKTIGARYQGDKGALKAAIKTVIEKEYTSGLPSYAVLATANPKW